MRNTLLALALLVFTTATTRAEMLAVYDFAGLPGDQAMTAGKSPVAGLWAGAIVRGPGLRANSGANSMNSNGWSTASVINLEDYYGFSLTADPKTNFTFSLTSLAFGDRRSGTGPLNFAIRTSLDEFKKDVATFTLPDTTTDNNRLITFPADEFTKLSNIEIRLYGFAAEATGGTYRLNNGVGSEAPGGLVVSGEVAAAVVVPAPASIVLLMSGAPALLLTLRRRKLQSGGLDTPADPKPSL